MKIIFLDIDGVLNSQAWYQKRGGTKFRRTEENHPACEFDPEAVANLNDLVEQTGARIVITSTWRSGGLEQMREVFQSVGIRGEILDVTPHLESRFRGLEIYQWIEDNEKLLGVGRLDFRSYVIIDDDSDMLYWQKDNLLIVDSAVGFNHTMAYRAKRILETFAESNAR